MVYFYRYIIFFSFTYIERWKIRGSQLVLACHFLNLSGHDMVKGGYHPWTISGAYFIFSDPWPCNLRAGERGWVNWPDASEIESTIESESSSLLVCNVCIGLSKWTMPILSSSSFPFLPLYAASIPCPTPGTSPGAVDVLFARSTYLPRPRFLTLIRFVDSDVCSYDCPCVHLWTSANGNRFLLSFPRNSSNGE